MRCVKCLKSDTRVVESRDSDEASSVRRRRECLKCGYRFTTYERLEVPYLVIVKKGGDQQPYSRDKLTAGIQKAVEKRPVNPRQIELVVDDIERCLFERGEDTIASAVIGELVMEQLLKLDDVAYVRFASVYRNFADVSGFEQALAKLRRTGHAKIEK